MTSLKATTYKEKPALEFIAQKEGEYFVVISNFEDHTEVELPEEEFMKLYDDKESGWKFS